jgi:hypothetical protein
MFGMTITRSIAGWIVVEVIACVAAGAIASISALPLMTSIAAATELTDQGLSFSDEKGGFRLLSVTGTGTRDDPITVTEDVTGPGNPVLIIRGFGAEFGERAGSFHTTGFAMKKVVINHTGKTWGSYRVELREVETRQSNYGDGLSFGQGDAGAEAYAASQPFADVLRTYEPADSVTFSNGLVSPGAAATLSFVVTDMSPVHQFFLFQQPTESIVERKAPAPKTRLARTMKPVSR